MTEGCLLSYCRLFKSKPSIEESQDASQAGADKDSKGRIIYGDYLQVKQQDLHFISGTFLRKKLRNQLFAVCFT